ncbi:hypothetical protein [Methylomagnum sp.]
MLSNLFRIAAVVALAGALVGNAQAKPDEVSEAEVKNCHLLGKVAGSSGYGKNLGWQPIAKASVEKKAGAIGATHIVFTDFRTVGAFNGEASARAYACQ